MIDADPEYLAITRSGNSGGYTYTVKPNYDDKPVAYVSWFCCARYCNWLHNGKPVGYQNIFTTEDGAYALNGKIYGDGDPAFNAVIKKVAAKYHIPTEDEWYKAAYYNGDGVYWKYATQSNEAPGAIESNSFGDGPVNSSYFCPIIATPTPTATPSTTISFTKNIETNGCNGNQFYPHSDLFPSCLNDCISSDPLGSDITRDNFVFSVSPIVSNPQGNTTYEWWAVSYYENCSLLSSPIILSSPCWRNATTDTIEFNNGCNGYYKLWCRVTNNGVVANSSVYFFEHNPIV
jgi:hypothetical protein